MKRLHLICNAHLDPIWLWEWEEGAAAALSTFRSAVNLAKEFDYIFCHNEVTLYKWIKEYDGELFGEIKKLIENGKWRVIGGWYLQPDCNLPSGESFVRQIMEGRKFFSENFNVRPTTAVNFDPFGHSVGLVQILKKTGYDSYLACRPGAHELNIPDNFMWEGLDGSRVKAKRASGHYNSPLGEATVKIRREIKKSLDNIDLVLWGVGNHGGGPSRKDLADIKDMMENSDVEIVHSTPEDFFKDCDSFDKFTHKQGINFCMPGCYTSMIRIKQLHRELENQLYMTEKMLSHASICGLLEYPHEQLNEAIYDLLNSEFHDILPGTAIKQAEEYGMRLMHHGIEILSRLRAKAFFALSRGEASAAPNTFPVLTYNPHPYAVSAAIDVGFNLEEQNYKDTFTNIIAMQGGKRLKTQVVKEASNLNLDWMKRVRVQCELPPMSISRIDLHKELLPAKPKLKPLPQDRYIFENKNVKITINLNTGFIDSIVRDGEEYLSSPLGKIKVYSDNEDPWAMSAAQLARLGEEIGEFKLMPKEEGSKYSGIDNTVIPSVRLIEDGEVLTEIEAVFKYNNSFAKVGYVIYHESNDIEVNVQLNFEEKNKIARLSFGSSIDGESESQIAFGREKLLSDGKEQIMHKWVRRFNKSKCLAVINRDVYGVRCEGNNINLTLVRGAGYAAHPIRDRAITPTDRLTPRMDQGERNYSFKVIAGGSEDIDARLEKEAAAFNERPFSLNVFPAGIGEKPKQKLLEFSNERVTLAALKASQNGGYIARLFNNSNQEISTKLTSDIFCIDTDIVFNKFEIKTFRIDMGIITECEEMEI